MSGPTDVRAAAVAAVEVRRLSREGFVDEAGVEEDVDAVLLLTADHEAAAIARHRAAGARHALGHAADLADSLGYELDGGSSVGLWLRLLARQVSD